MANEQVEVAPPAEAEKTTEENPTPEVSMAELERMTNAEEGWVPEGQSPEIPKPETAHEMKATAPVAAGQALPPELKLALSDTPFSSEEDVIKGVQGLVKSYKEATSQFTKTTTRIKPYEQLIGLAEKDSQFAQALRLAQDAYLNPSLAEAYTNQLQGLQRPDPSQYDLYDPNARAAYDKAQVDYEARLVDSRINARFASIEQERGMNKAITEFKQLVPDGDANALMKWINEDFANLPVGERMRGFWELKNLPQTREKIYAEVRKDLEGKLKIASAATPAAPATPNQAPSDEEIAKYVIQYGPKSAYGRYKKPVVEAAIARITNAVYAE